MLFLISFSFFSIKFIYFIFFNHFPLSPTASHQHFVKLFIPHIHFPLIFIYPPFSIYIYLHFSIHITSYSYTHLINPCYSYSYRAVRYFTLRYVTANGKEYVWVYGGFVSQFNSSSLFIFIPSLKTFFFYK